MLNIIRRMRTREPTCLSIGLGVFLAINFSYATIVERNVTDDGVNAIRDFPLIDQLASKKNENCLYFSVVFAWLQFSYALLDRQVHTVARTT